MPPTPPSHDDVLDFDGLDLKPSGAKKSTASESDFEKELEALFAEDLASSDEKPASAPPVGAPEFEEDALLLDDLVEDSPIASKSAPASVSETEAEAEDDILDLSAFEAGGELELSPPEDVSGGKDGIIDLGGLDELISGLGETSASVAPAAAAPVEQPQLDGTDLDSLLEKRDVPHAVALAPEVEPIELADPIELGEPIELAEPIESGQPVEAPAAALDAEDGLLELSLGDLVADAPEVPALDLEVPAASKEAESVLDLTLPDFSAPEPGRDLVAEQEQADMGGELNLSLDNQEASPAAAPVASPAASMGQLFEGDLGMDDLMEGLETSEGEPASDLSLDPEDLLAQIPDAGGQAESVLPAEAPPEPLADLPLSEDLLGNSALDLMVPEPAVQEMLPLADAALAGAAGAAMVAEVATVPVSALGAGVSDEALAALQEGLAQLSTQVTGNSVAVVRLEGKLAEREKNLAELEARLQASQSEAQSLREELVALRAHLEDSLRVQDEAVQQELAQSAQSAADKSQGAMDKALGAMDKALAALDKAQRAADKADALTPRVESAEMTVRGAGARLAQMENRQTQLDREVFAEITRAVPREAAKVIREEIAHLAASMRDE